MTDHSFNPIFEEVGSLGDIGIECFITLKLETIRVVGLSECYSELLVHYHSGLSCSRRFFTDDPRAPSMVNVFSVVVRRTYSVVTDLKAASFSETNEMSLGSVHFALFFLNG